MKDSYYVDPSLSHVLDESLKVCKELISQGKSSYIVPVIGLTGSGKTSNVSSWLKLHDYKNSYLDCTLIKNDCKSNEFIELINKMNKTDNIVVFDNYDKASENTRRSIFDMFNGRAMDQDGKTRVFNPLLTIVIIDSSNFDIKVISENIKNLVLGSTI